MSPGSRNKSAKEEQRRLAARRPNLRLRAKIVQAIRNFFVEHDYLEIETPHIIPAPAPEAHIDAVRAGNGFLHTSPELCMKRLLCAGYSKIFQICKCFRQAERGTHHLPEFTLLEWYRTGIDYIGLMDECEEMILSVSHDLGLGETIAYQGRNVDLRRPWERVSVKEAFDRYAGISVEKALASGRFDQIVAEQIERHLGIHKPVFLYDYPVGHAALAQPKADEPALAERFEIYIAGLELANAFSELRDVREQRRRFERERDERDQLGKTSYPIPKKFLEALCHMPPSAGIALGVDRLVMLFADQGSIDGVVPFTVEEL